MTAIAQAFELPALRSPVDEALLAGPDAHFAAQRFLNREARLLATGAQRAWLTGMVAPEIRYVVASRQYRYRRDERVTGVRDLLIYDDDYAALDDRVQQVETGQQWRADPAERFCRLVTNVEVYATDAAGTWRVLSTCLVARYRRVYEEDLFIYARDDLLAPGPDGGLRLRYRTVEFDQRYVEGRNLLFFL